MKTVHSLSYKIYTLKYIEWYNYQKFALAYFELWVEL